MDYDLFLKQVKSLEGEVFYTKTGKPFTVGVYMTEPFFVPQSTMQGRADGRKATERFLQRYLETRSPKVSDYKDVTQNASNLIPLMHRLEQID